MKVVILQNKFLILYINQKKLQCICMLLHELLISYKKQFIAYVIDRKLIAKNAFTRNTVITSEVNTQTPENKY